MSRQGWIAVVIAVGVATFVIGAMAGGVVGSQAFPESSPSPVPSVSLVPSPSPVEVEVPGPERTPKVCRVAIRRADDALSALNELGQHFAETGQFSVELADNATIARDDYDEAADRCYKS